MNGRSADSAYRAPKWRIATAAVVIVLAGALPASAVRREPIPVDLQLVLAVDVSGSMDEDEQQLQRDGYLEAVVSTPVLSAIGRGAYGRIAIAYVEWSGADDQRTVVHWSLIDGRKSAEAFAAKLAAVPLHRAARTSISGALAHAAAIFADSGFESERRVIDISGDGPNNEGPPVDLERDAVLAQGVTINGLPLTLKPATYMASDQVPLADYYRDCVVGGPSSFTLPVDRLIQFPDAIKTKLVREIADAGTPDDRERARAEAPFQLVAAAAVDCRTSGKFWGE